jgi:hypothetical protein
LGVLHPPALKQSDFLFRHFILKLHITLYRVVSSHRIRRVFLPVFIHFA